jgi:hypothetical protein
VFVFATTSAGARLIPSDLLNRSLGAVDPLRILLLLNRTANKTLDLCF